MSPRCPGGRNVPPPHSCCDVLSGRDTQHCDGWDVLGGHGVESSQSNSVKIVQCPLWPILNTKTRAGQTSDSLEVVCLKQAPQASVFIWISQTCQTGLEISQEQDFSCDFWYLLSDFWSVLWLGSRDECCVARRQGGWNQHWYLLPSVSKAAELWAVKQATQSEAGSGLSVTDYWVL